MSGEIDALLRQGHDHHQAGRLEEAERSYRAVLQLERDNVHALYC